MMFPEKMIQVFGIMARRYNDAVTQELLRQGLVHFIKIDYLDPGIKEKLATADESSDNAEGPESRSLTDVRKRSESFLRMGGYADLIPATLPDDIEPVLDRDRAEDELDTFAARIEAVRNRQSNIQANILKFEDIKRQLDMHGDVKNIISQSSPYAFLQIHSGHIDASFFEDFKNEFATLPSLVTDISEKNSKDKLVLVINMKRDESTVKTILDRYQWSDSSLSSYVDDIGGAARTGLDDKIAELKKEQQHAASEFNDIFAENKEKLLDIYTRARLNEMCLKVKSYLKNTQHTLFFSGWLPLKRKRDLEKAMTTATAGEVYFEWLHPGESSSGEQSDAPVKLNNPRFLKPFEMLVENFAIPAYGTIDPTPFVAVAYLIMFGLMFSDAGHGLVLILGGFAGIRFIKASDTFHKLFQLIVYCGFSAVIFGVLFGSYFGFQWFKPIWFDYHGIIAGHSSGNAFVKDIFGILKITIYFGIFIIAAGLLFNWINVIIKKRWKQLVFDKTGLLGGWLYASGVYTAFYYVQNDYKSLPDNSFLIPMIAVPALLFFLKPIVEFLLPSKTVEHKHKLSAFTVVEILMEWIVEMLEIFSGFLANTLSFMRVAGLGIAHVSLMIAFYEIALMVANDGRLGILSYVILLFGNVLVILLEGLSAGIQSLRLNYYEFFSKFFQETGYRYKPISLSTKD